MTNTETTYKFKLRMSWDCMMTPLEGITKVITDSDLDGLIAAAILKASKSDIEVYFAHPALLRAGSLDHIIDRHTALCDLPFHPSCGLYLDHHITNKPSEGEEKRFTAEGGICVWRDTPSAARAAYDLMKDKLDISHLDEIMPMVDALDSGGISLQDFMDDGPVIQLSRSLSISDSKHMQTVLYQFSSGMPLEEILKTHENRLKKLSEERKLQESFIRERTEIIDGLAVCDLSETGVRSNGYLITAMAGVEALACCVIHGYMDGSIENPNRQALGASFYANSFRDQENPYDLSLLATLLDETGGGHANACGCRIQPADGSKRDLNEFDKKYNLDKWLELWAKRNIKMLR